MATCSHLLNHVQIKGWPSRIRISKLGNLSPTESFKTRSERQPKQGLIIAQCSFQFGAPCPTTLSSLKPSDDIDAVSNIFRTGGSPGTSHTVSNLMHKLVVADLDPATAKLAIGFLGPFFSLFSFLFIIRIVMSWYPKLPVGKFPYVVAYAPTEPILMATRKVIPPLPAYMVSYSFTIIFISVRERKVVENVGMRSSPDLTLQSLWTEQFRPFNLNPAFPINRPY